MIWIVLHKVDFADFVGHYAVSWDKIFRRNGKAVT